jgi:ferric-dicitrate binding protein FerR (iron transport regulator)
MTPNGIPGDDSEALRILVQAISVVPAGTEGSDVGKAAQHLFGRADALELAREVLLEEQLLRKLRAERGGCSRQGSGPSRNEPPRVLPIPSFANGAAGSRSRRPWRTLGLAAAAALVAGVGLNWTAMSGLLRAIRPGSSPVPATVSTRAAQLDTVSLPDGSRAILAPNSILRYAMDSVTGPRELRLEGEAYFEVEHDNDRPFRVQTRHAVVEDLGTSFVVREYAGDGRARVAVRSGVAALHARNASQTSPTSLRPGDGAYVDSSGAIARFSGDPESYGSWTRGRFEFDAAPLPDVLSQLARWYDVEFRVTDSTLVGQYFTGAFDAVSLPRALEILGPIVHARFEQQGREVMVTPRPGGR